MFFIYIWHNVIINIIHKYYAKARRLHKIFCNKLYRFYINFSYGVAICYIWLSSWIIQNTRNWMRQCWCFGIKYSRSLQGWYYARCNRANFQYMQLGSCSRCTCKRSVDMNYWNHWKYGWWGNGIPKNYQGKGTFGIINDSVIRYWFSTSLLSSPLPYHNSQ